MCENFGIWRHNDSSNIDRVVTAMQHREPDDRVLLFMMPGGQRKDCLLPHTIRPASNRRSTPKLTVSSSLLLRSELWWLVD